MVFEASACCDPPLPGKAIKLFFSALTPPSPQKRLCPEKSIFFFSNIANIPFFYLVDLDASNPQIGGGSPTGLQMGSAAFTLGAFFPRLFTSAWESKGPACEIRQNATQEYRSQTAWLKVCFLSSNIGKLWHSKFPNWMWNLLSETLIWTECGIDSKGLV